MALSGIFIITRRSLFCVVSMMARFMEQWMWADLLEQAMDIQILSSSIANPREEILEVTTLLNNDSI